MKFADAEAEEYYKELRGEFGYFHLNSCGNDTVLTLEDLMNLRKTLEALKKKKGKGD